MNGRFPLVGDDWSEDVPYLGALLIPVDHRGRILLQLRDFGSNTVHPGKWSLFGGGVEGAESLEQAVVREFQEEVGITLPTNAVLPFVRVLSEPGRRRLYVFSATLEIAPADIRLGEGAGFGFIEPSNIAALNMIPFRRPVLARFINTT